MASPLDCTVSEYKSLDGKYGSVAPLERYAFFC